MASMSSTVRVQLPEIYQWLHERVRPEREQNPRESRRRNWWLFGETNPSLRKQLVGLRRYAATCKHRFFLFLDAAILPDDKLVAVTLDSGFALGVLSSRLHANWAMETGGWLGVGNDPVYNKTNCFETFPFPEISERQRTLIGDLAKQIDVRRKKRQELYPALKLTDVYNVLEKLRTGEELTDKDKQIHEQGLVTVLAELHDELDAAVLDAYGWSDLAPALVGKPGGLTPSHNKTPEQEEAEETLLERLVALNAARAAEEARGVIRWLRPEFQDPKGAIREVLAEQPAPLAPIDLARCFKSAQTRRVAELLATLESLGQARETDGSYGP